MQILGMDNSIPLQGSPQDFTVKTKEMESLAKKKLQGGGGEGKETQWNGWIGKRNWLRWLLAEEIVAGWENGCEKKNGLAEVTDEVARQVIRKKTKELTKLVEKSCWQKGRVGWRKWLLKAWKKG